MVRSSSFCSFLSLKHKLDTPSCPLSTTATAAGMMLAASASLVYEGLVLESDIPCVVPQTLRVILGIIGGLVFIVSTKTVLDRHEDLKVAGLDGKLPIQAMMRRALCLHCLIITLPSADSWNESLTLLYFAPHYYDTQTQGWKLVKFCF